MLFRSLLKAFVDTGVDPRGASRALVFDHKIHTDPTVHEELKLRADLAADKGRIHKVLNQMRKSPTLEKVDAEKFTVTGHNLGSNPAVQLVDAAGKKFYFKSAASLAHAEDEVLAQAFYDMMNIPCVRSILVKQGEFGLKGPCLMAEWLEGVTKHNPSTFEHRLAAQQAFVVSCWLGNWDVPGLVYDNISASGQVLDTGGSLRFRAQGAKKGKFWGNEVTELTKMRDASVNPQAAKTFGDISDLMIEEQARKLVNTMDDSIIAKFVNAFYSDEAEAKLMIDTLIARREDIRTKVLGKEEAIKHAAAETSQEVHMVNETIDAMNEIFPEGHTHLDTIIDDLHVEALESHKLDDLARSEEHTSELQSH